jgi:S-adenosylmethionine/arginine decarboxylase-like enzyme
MHNQKKALLSTLVSVTHGVNYNLIVGLSTYQHFKGDGGILLTNGSRLSLHTYRNPGFKMGLVFEYMHI